ncbi:MAG: hypothetical protein DRH37_10980, partial [Deltaproteobacteria bacterium]
MKKLLVLLAIITLARNGFTAIPDTQQPAEMKGQTELITNNDTAPNVAFVTKEWPVLKHYDQEYTDRIALPVGGIGTGTVSLGGRGNLQDWEIMGRPAKGYNP